MLSPRKLPQTLIFDLDGTLIDSVRLTCAIIDTMLAERGAPVCADPAVARAHDAVGGEAMIAAVMGPYCRDAAADIARFRALHADVSTPADLAFPGVARTLASLAGAGYIMAICSNKPQALCDRILTDLGLCRHFSTIVGSRPGLPRKPAGDAARLALAGTRTAPEAALYIGDSAIDVATARAAGLPLALAGWGYGVVEAQAAAPDAPVFADMASLGRHLL
jgi:phosphoglycolate phosphatase